MTFARQDAILVVENAINTSLIQQCEVRLALSTSDAWNAQRLLKKMCVGTYENWSGVEFWGIDNGRPWRVRVAA